MKDVDFGRLSEQYAGFLVAVGGVSITVLTVVLSLDDPKARPLDALGIRAQSFLVAALIVATVSCFVGAHMMAETAAFFSKLKSQRVQRNRPDEIPLGQRLFVLATANIFIAITLVLFAMVLLPLATGQAQLAATIKPISVCVFPSVALGALLWMIFASLDRSGLDKGSWYVTLPALLAGGLSACLYYFYLADDWLLPVLFVSVVVFVAASLVYFALVFKFKKTCTPRWCSLEVVFFSSAITISNACLIAAYFRIIRNF